MKKDYHKMDTYQADKKSDKINAMQVSYKDFSDWGTLLNDSYGLMKVGSVFKYHLFTYAKLPATIKYQRVHFSEEIENQILIKGKNKILNEAQHLRRRQKVKDSELVCLKNIGLKSIKEVEMWSKWGYLIDDEED